MLVPKLVAVLKEGLRPPSQALRIQRKPLLQTLNGVSDQMLTKLNASTPPAYRSNDVRRLHPRRRTCNNGFQRPQNAVQKRALTGEDLRHVSAHGNSDRDYGGDEKQNLQIPLAVIKILPARHRNKCWLMAPTAMQR